MTRGAKPAPGFSAAPSPAAASRRWLVYVAAGLFCTVLFVIATLPAYWVDWLLNRVAPGSARIHQATGTIWNGTGHLRVHSLGQELLQTGIAWSVQPWWLATGKLQLRISGQDPTAPLKATLRVGYRYLSIHQVDAIIPANLAAVLHPAVSLVAPTGRLQIVAEQATLTPAGLQGQLQLTWLNAGAGMSGLSELGDYLLAVNGRGADAELRVETLRGDVRITAQGQWQTQGEGLFQLSGTLVPGSREQNLRPLLTMANMQNHNGQYQWTVNNRLPLARIFGSSP